jgi:NAD(P)-dependent dehydrogenase (short-subunit alcohol dehydrogenase family)
MNPDRRFSLAGKAALITGGSSGIGLSIAEALAEEGATIVIVGRDPVKLNRATERLAKFSQGKVDAISADVSDTSTHFNLVQEAMEFTGRLDILVNAAGTHFKKNTFEVAEEEYDHLMNINLRAMFFLCQKVGRYMKDHNGGKIINIASLGSYRSFHEVAPYCISKAGVEMLTKTLACEWARYNIAVNAIVPGFFRTPLNAKALDIPERMQAILARTPAGRIGQLDELQGAAVFLASAASDYVRGHSLAVDGGFLAFGV